MPSCLLYFGPGARQVAVDEAGRIGRMIAPPMGDDGLKTEDAREAVRIMSNVPVTSEISTLVIGPVDLAMPRASDVLLKRIEDFDDTRIQPILWAHDVSGVTPTIRSRCLDRWVDIPDDDVDQELVDDGFDVVEAFHNDAIYKIPGMVAKYKKREHDFIGAVADALSTDDRPKSRVLWEHLRPVSLLQNPTEIEIISALVGGSVG